MGVYRAEIWAVSPNGTVRGIESDITIDDLESRAWSGAVLGSTLVPGRGQPGPVYVRVGNRTAAADLVVVEGADSRVEMLGVSPFE